MRATDRWRSLTMRYCFGTYTLNTHTYELHRAGQLVQLQPKVFELLTYLMRHRTLVCLNRL
jgi:DNA-binding response OmpR family regulator